MSLAWGSAGGSLMFTFRNWWLPAALAIQGLLWWSAVRTVLFHCRGLGPILIQEPKSCMLLSVAYINK